MKHIGATNLRTDYSQIVTLVVQMCLVPSGSIIKQFINDIEKKNCLSSPLM